MYYYFQPRYYQSPYTQAAYQPVVNSPLRNPSRPMHHTAHHSQVNPNMRYVAQHNGVPEQHGQNQQPQNRSSFPPANPDFLYESAKESNKLMKEASMVLDKLASSKEFDARLMDFAQQSNTKEVKNLIQSVGITSDVDIKYNPDGLELEFKSKVKDQDCCKLSISLRWR